MRNNPCRPPSTGPVEDSALEAFESTTRQYALEAKQHAGSERGERAFELLARVLMHSAVRIARAILRDILGTRYDPDDVLDVVNLSLFQLYRSINSYKPGTSVIPWFRTIVRTTVIDFVREQYHIRAKHGPEIQRMGYSSQQVPTPEVSPEQVDLERVIASLSDDEQKVLDLVFRREHSQGETAEIMGKSVSWVRARVRKIRAAFSDLH